MVRRCQTETWGFELDPIPPHSARRPGDRWPQRQDICCAPPTILPQLRSVENVLCDGMVMVFLPMHAVNLNPHGLESHAIYDQYELLKH